MGYSAGFLHDIIQPLNRKEAVAGKFGLDSAGIEWEPVGCLHANVDYQRGKSAMNAGSLDAYAVKMSSEVSGQDVSDHCRDVERKPTREHAAIPDAVSSKR